MNDEQFRAFLGQTIDCACGKTHHVEPGTVIYEEGALEQLPSVLGEAVPGKVVAVVMDTRTRAVAGAAAVRLLGSAGWDAREIVVPDPREGATPVCDTNTHDRLLKQIGRPDAMLAVGAGVVNDLGKWAAHDLGIPYVCFGTAASMNGYASANIAVAINGVKSLIWARPPEAILADPAILRDAPPKLTTAGLGDVLAKSVSSTDWRLNALLFADYFCERSASLIANIEPLCLDHPEGRRDHDADAMAALFRALLLTGMAMTMVGTSSPASGAEHLISHALDMMSSIDGEPHDLHGRQVGVGTVLAAEVYRRVLAVESPRL
ncbi:MAG TPA: iron-containing alcohol dehydrogenase, partial [Planctomycetota bacterium]|nr:iron-containing alcohol dehydrogenase [Planctomycetota bacterium]